MSNNLLQAKSHRKSFAPDARVRIDGRFFSRGDERLSMRGVTYGPFLPTEPRTPFPPRRVVRQDCAQIVEAGFNSLRTYHVPPPWFLDLVGETEKLGILIDV